MPLADFPRLPIGHLPTPVEPLRSIGRELGIDLWAKRDDYTGFALGGNKIRKLEYLLPAAQAAGATMLISAGGVQSNHCRMTAAVARKFGMKALLVLRGSRPDVIQGNLLLDQLFGAEIDYVAPAEFNAGVDALLARRAEAMRQRGEVPYVIPVGGSTPLGAMGYVNCVAELAAQYRALDRPVPDHLVVTAGSGGTLAGLHVGCAVHWPHTRIIGILVTVSPIPYRERLMGQTNAAAQLLGIERRWQADDFHIEEGYVGAGYAIPTEAGTAAIQRAATSEGMLLDPVYTGKTFAGLIGCVANGTIPRASTVLFVHTGGAPALFHFGGTG